MISTRFVSIGTNCQVAHQINRYFRYSDSYPFDWLITEVKHLSSIFDSGFERILCLHELETYNNGVRHRETGTIFYHDFKNPSLIENEISEVRAKYNYLYSKFLDLGTHDKLVFVNLSDQKTDTSILKTTLTNLFPKSDVYVLSISSSNQRHADVEALEYEIRQPSPYKWRGDDKEWDYVFDSALRALQTDKKSNDTDIMVDTRNEKTLGLESQLPIEAHRGAGESLATSIDYTFLDHQAVLIALLDRIEKRVPTSLLRLGDGEGYIMDNGSYGTSVSEVEFILSVWFGKKKFSTQDVQLLRALLFQSLDTADFIGLFSPATKKQAKYLRPYNILSGTGYLTDRTVCEADVHLKLHNEGLLAKILHTSDNVGLITCRDVGANICKHFGIKSLTWFPVPEEMHYASSTNVDLPHFPDWFNSMSDNLLPDFEGQVWFVGAGILGKYYCHVLKSRGAIAIDIGSVFDQWASFSRRGSVRANRIGL